MDWMKRVPYATARGIAAVWRLFAVPAMFVLVTLLLLDSISFAHAQRDIHPVSTAATDFVMSAASSELLPIVSHDSPHSEPTPKPCARHEYDKNRSMNQTGSYGQITGASTTTVFGTKRTAATRARCPSGDEAQSCGASAHARQQQQQQTTTHEQRWDRESRPLDYRNDSTSAFCDCAEEHDDDAGEEERDGAEPTPLIHETSLMHKAKQTLAGVTQRMRELGSARAAWSTIHSYATSTPFSTRLQPPPEQRTMHSEQTPTRHHPFASVFLPLYETQQHHELIISDTGVYRIDFTGYVGNTIHAVVQLSSHLYNSTVPRNNCESFDLSAQLQRAATPQTAASLAANRRRRAAHAGSPTHAIESSQVYDIVHETHGHTIPNVTNVKDTNDAIEGDNNNDNNDPNDDDAYNGASWSVFWSSLAAMFDTSAFCEILPSVSMRIDRAQRTQTYTVVVHARNADSMLRARYSYLHDTDKDKNDARHEDAHPDHLFDGVDHEQEGIAALTDAHTVVGNDNEMVYTGESAQCVLQVYIDQESESKMRTERYLLGLLLPLCVLLVPLPLMLWHIDVIHEHSDEVEFTDWLWYPPYLMRDGIIWLGYYLAHTVYTYWITRRQRYRQQRLRQRHEELMQFSDSADPHATGIGGGGGSSNEPNMHVSSSNNANIHAGSSNDKRADFDQDDERIDTSQLFVLRSSDKVQGSVDGGGRQGGRWGRRRLGGMWGRRSGDVVVENASSDSEEKDGMPGDHNYTAVARERTWAADERTRASPLISFTQPNSLVLLSHEQQQQQQQLSGASLPLHDRSSESPEELETAIRIRDDSDTDNEDTRLGQRSRSRPNHSLSDRGNEAGGGGSSTTPPLGQDHYSTPSGAAITRVYPVSKDHTPGRSDTRIRRHVSLSAPTNTLTSAPTSFSLAHTQSSDGSTTHNNNNNMNSSSSGSNNVRRRLAKPLASMQTAHRHDLAEDSSHASPAERPCMTVHSSGSSDTHHSSHTKTYPPSLELNSSHVRRGDATHGVLLKSEERDAMLRERHAVCTGHDMLFQNPLPQPHKPRESIEYDALADGKGNAAVGMDKDLPAASLANGATAAAPAAATASSTRYYHAHNIGHARGQATKSAIASEDEKDDEGERVCRICREGIEDGPLVAPCACTGSVRWVHRHCLDHWRIESAKRNLASMNECEICKQPFTIGIRRSVVFWQGSRHIIQASLLVVTYVLTVYLIATLSYDVVGRASCSASYHRVAWKSRYMLEGLCLSGMLYAMVVLVLCGGYEVVYSWWRARPDVDEYIREMHISPPFLTHRRRAAIALVSAGMLAQIVACGYLLKFAMYQVSQAAWSWELSPVMGGIIYACVLGVVMQLRVWMRELSPSRLTLSTATTPPATPRSTSPAALPADASGAAELREDAESVRRHRRDATSAMVSLTGESAASSRETRHRSASPSPMQNSHTTSAAHERDGRYNHSSSSGGGSNSSMRNSNSLLHTASLPATPHTTVVRMRGNHSGHLDTDNTHEYVTESDNNSNSSIVAAGASASCASGLREVRTAAGMPRHVCGRGRRHLLQAQRDGSLGPDQREARSSSSFTQSSSSNSGGGVGVSIRAAGTSRRERDGQADGAEELNRNLLKSNHSLCSISRSNNHDNANEEDDNHTTMSRIVSESAGGGTGEDAVRSVAAPVPPGSTTAPARDSEASMFDTAPELRVIRAMEYCPPRRTFKNL